jgi:ATP-dependent DNA helicase HFM1/MER3
LPALPASEEDNELLLDQDQESDYGETYEDVPSRSSETLRHFPSPGRPLTGRPPVIRGIQLVSPHELPDKFRQVFKYNLFNAVQSKCFEPIYKTNDNVVISAPTGSGKTAILELAICRLAMTFGSGQYKIVYQAPTKSLCSERVRDWSKKFAHLNLPCAELTGDTDSSEMRKVGEAAILVTTPEKWDSITRKWKDHIKLLRMVKLFLIDEVHILRDLRGATLEAVVSRMKTIGSDVRFIALSATVPNSEDIASWLGKDHTRGHLPAHREVFGEEFRPVMLQKHVYGYTGSPNEYAFDKFLDSKLPQLITKHTKHKPIMIFCFTRKSCEETAAKLAAFWAESRITARSWPAPSYKAVVGEPLLLELVGKAVAFHHAGLNVEDRAAVEKGFLNGAINVICCTSTLAVGVNLPCHLVIVKNTMSYGDHGLAEYSDLELMQMLGRAGRPQFDDSAVAIIVTRSEKADRYKNLISGQDILESTLHLNLIEHLNSEIALGTVNDAYSAKVWLKGTFLAVRMRLNPTYYKLSCDTGTRDTDHRLELVCERDVEMLQKHKLITSDAKFTTTEYGQAMSKYMVQFETMKLLLSIPKHAKMTQILHFVAQAAEFKHLRLKPTERVCLRELNKSPFIKAPIKENISTYAHKVSLIVQVQLGGVDLPSDKDFNSIRKQFITDTGLVFERIKRLIRCIIECKAYDRDAVATSNALELARSIAAGFWENTPLQLRQVSGIGPAGARKLIQANIRTVEELASLDTAGIERALSRNPPYGKKMLDMLAAFPRLTLEAEIVKKQMKENVSVHVQVKALLGFRNSSMPSWMKKAPAVTFTAATSGGNLAYIWRGPIKQLQNRHQLGFTVELVGAEDTVVCCLACEEIVGTAKTIVLVPGVPREAFPERKVVEEVEKVDENPGEDGAMPAEEIYYPDDGASTRAVVKNTRRESDYGDSSIFDEIADEFVDIYDLDAQAQVAEEGKSKQQKGHPQQPTDEPVRLPNGNWQCNHACTGGVTTKGQPCKHPCCKNGLESRPKPRKPSKKAKASKEDSGKPQASTSTHKPADSHTLGGSKLRLKRPRAADDYDDFEDIEVMDLINGPPELSAADRDRHRRGYSLTPEPLVVETPVIQTPAIKTKLRRLSSHLAHNDAVSRADYRFEPTQQSVSNVAVPDHLHDLELSDEDDLPSPDKLFISPITPHGTGAFRRGSSRAGEPTTSEYEWMNLQHMVEEAEKDGGEGEDGPFQADGEFEDVMVSLEVGQQLEKEQKGRQGRSGSVLVGDFVVIGDDTNKRPCTPLFPTEAAGPAKEHPAKKMRLAKEKVDQEARVVDTVDTVEEPFDVSNVWAKMVPEGMPEWAKDGSVDVDPLIAEYFWGSGDERGAGLG